MLEPKESPAFRHGEYINPKDLYSFSQLVSILPAGALVFKEENDGFFSPFQREWGLFIKDSLLRLKEDDTSDLFEFLEAKYPQLFVFLLGRKEKR